MLSKSSIVVVALGIMFWSSAIRAQEPPAKARLFAPGVVTVIPPVHEEGETFTGPLGYVEILNSIPAPDWTPNFSPKSAILREKAKQVTFRRNIWHLEFGFKPLRRVYIDMPLPTGKMQRKLIWYMVYYVKNVGHDWKPVAKDLDLKRDPREEFKPKIFDIEDSNSELLRFFPEFVFRGRAQIEGQYETKEYLDRIIPAALETISARERVGVPLYNSVEISSQPIKLSSEKVDRSVWGVVTWEDIDPRIDYFSIFVHGLTNSHKLKDAPEQVVKGSPPATGRRFAYKTLQMNFWRAGDSVLEHEDEIRFGARIEPDEALQNEILTHYGLRKPLDYLWVYR